jgi:hypothetical protein
VGCKSRIEAYTEGRALRCGVVGQPTLSCYWGVNQALTSPRLSLTLFNDSLCFITSAIADNSRFD